MQFLQIPVCHQTKIHVNILITFIFGFKIQEIYEKKEKRKRAELFLAQKGFTEFD